MQQKRVKSVQ